MIPEKQLQEIRDYLKKTENPLFFHDDDPDGICSYLLLKKYIDKGKGTMVKMAPILDSTLLRKVEEYSPDYIFIVDIPIVTQEFIDSVNVPVVWIDHHPPVKLKGVHYYNPRLNEPKDKKPATYYCYKVTKQNIWLAMIGCLGDGLLPEFTKDFIKEYPDLLDEDASIKKAIYNSRIGKLVEIFSFTPKGRTSEVNKAVNIISKIESPYEILDQTTPKGKYIVRRIKGLYSEYEKLLKKALAEVPKEKVFFFSYATSKNSFTSELATDLLHKHPSKIIIVGREKDDRIKLSIRSSNIDISKVTKDCMSNIRGYAGGHEFACGGNILKEDFPIFLKRFKDKIKQKKI